MIDFYLGSFKARKYLNNRHKSDLLQYLTGNGLRHTSGPVLPIHPLHICIFVILDQFITITLTAGFRKQRSTMTAWLEIQQEWAENSDNKKVTGILLWDLSAAFDTLDCNIIFT